MVHKNCKENDFKEICSLMQFSKILNKELKLYPKIGVYISNMLPGDDIFDKEENENINLNDYNKINKMYKDCYKNSIKEQKEIILNRAQKRFPDLFFQTKDVEIIAGGPFMNEKEPKKNIKLGFYWCSIHEIFESFVKFFIEGKKEKENSNNNNIHITNLIKTLFEIFSDIEKLDDDFNLRNFLVSYLEKKFDNHSIKQFSLKLEKVKEDIKINFLKYIDILNDDIKAKESLTDCFQNELLGLYEKLIPKKIQSFIDLSLEKYRTFIKEQIEAQFDSISENILSPENIEFLIQDVKELIINAEFREDIDMNLLSNNEFFWDCIYEQNKTILNYYKTNKENLFIDLKNNFISKINKIFQGLLSVKKTWANYLKETLIKIQKIINKKYSEMLKQCNYQEDIKIYVQDSKEFFNSIFPSIELKYFISVSEKRIKEVKEKVKQIINEEYNKILENKLPFWSNIKKDISLRIKESINNYFSNIFQGIEFRDQIEPNLGSKDFILRLIPYDIKNNSQITANKKIEIDKIIEREINNTINIFNQKRNNLPLFNEFVDSLIKQCTKIIDNKMEEIINSFHYIEDKKLFNSDYIFSLLTKDQTIYKNCSTKIEEINKKLRELCEIKSKEYDLMVGLSKREWEQIKSDKISKINKICLNYIQKIFSEAEFQEDIKEIDINDLNKLIYESKDFYEDIQGNKINEINKEVDKIVSQIENKIITKKNSFQKWDTIKSQLIQKAYIEMTNKSNSDLKTKDLDEVTIILVSHLDTIPDFYSQCKTEQRKKELINELKQFSVPIALDYIERAKEEENRRRLEEERERIRQRQIQEEQERRREAERREQEERRRRDDENRRRQEEERRRREDENRRRQEEERRRREDENRRREEERRRQEDHRNHIEDLARRTIRGEFGNGQTRKNRLGGLYNEVQNRVNEILGFPKRYQLYLLI